MPPDFRDQRTRPRIKRSVQQIRLPGGDLILIRAHGEDVRVRDIEPGDLELLCALDGTCALGELERRFGARPVHNALAAMAAHGLIDDARDDEVLEADTLERFDRQLRYFGEIAPADALSAAACQERLALARIAVLGTGGLGGRAAIDLASIGVGELWLADGDLVETSNLARQIQFVEADVGRRKPDRLAARIGTLNSATRTRTLAKILDSVEQIAEFIEGADLVIDAADWPPHEIERRCNTACFALGIPYIAMSHLPPTVRVGPLYVPGRTGCYACQEAAFRREYPLYDLAAQQRSQRPIPAATLGPACGLTAGWVAIEAMHFLTGLVEPRTLGAGYTLDLLSARIERHEVIPEPCCPVCSALREPIAVGPPV
jgi:molybdopterin-synthase adenylyltransferase